MNDNERKKFMYDIRVEEKPQYDEEKELKKYQRFLNTSAFDDLNKVEVSPYRGDEGR